MQQTTGSYSSVINNPTRRRHRQLSVYGKQLYMWYICNPHTTGIETVTVFQ